MHLPYYTDIYILRTAEVRSSLKCTPPPPAEKAAYEPANPDDFRIEQNLHNYMFIIPDQKMYFWKQISLNLRNYINASTHAPPVTRSWETALLQKIIWVGILYECVHRFIFSPFNFLWSNTRNWEQLYFCNWLLTVCDFIWVMPLSRFRNKITTVIWPVIGWDHFQGW